MKRFVTILAACAAAATLFSCAHLDDAVVTKSASEDSNIENPADQVPAEPEEGNDENVETTPEVKDVFAVFEEMYPDAQEVEWEDEDGYWEVEFVTYQDGYAVEHEALFDMEGNWIMTETEISVNDIPQYVFDALAASEYASAQLEDDEADFIETPAGSWYVLELEMGDLEYEVAVSETGEITLLEIDD